MLLKHRPPGIKSEPIKLREGLDHLDQKSISVLRWLVANRVDFVVVGPVAYAIRGDTNAKGPLAIVPAPYNRNFERLCNALIAEHAGLRADRSLPGSAARPEAVAVKLTAEKLARGKRWMLRFGGYDLDLEAAGRSAAGPSAAGPSAAGPSASARSPIYQELLYESGRIELAPGLAVEVASPEDLEHYSHVRRTGAPPEFRVTRKAEAEHETA